MILKTLVVGPFASNCYIVGSASTKQGMIIDTGAEPEKILNSIKELGLEIKFIVLTHGHMDHIGALEQVMEATGAEVAVHTDDAGLLQRQPKSPVDSSAHQASSPYRLLNGGDSVDFGDMNFLVLHTPGHSRGGICLLGQGVVFSGDTLFNYGIGRYDLSGGSYNQLMDSLHTKLMVLPDETIVYPGHGPDTTIGAERRGNPFLRGQF
ncbi:MBL fold metallo-hydrolase [Chloroflexota bacterium]